MIEKCTAGDIPEIYSIINDAARAYKNVITPDCYHEPYMSMHELNNQIRQGVVFWCEKQDQKISGVMGIQDKKLVTLIRHAYIRTTERNKGIGTRLLQHLQQLTKKPILIGTWADATWAISFYEKNGFYLLPTEEKNRLLEKYWTISDRQKQTSVVLVQIGQAVRDLL
ncbi:MAG: GNAT family N-acetyltransferase [Flavisolibacter sp.]